MLMRVLHTCMGGSVAKIATGHGRAAAAVVQAAIWNNPAMKVA
jgi:hypothetical protein